MTYNQDPDACDECAEPVTDDDAAPSCGSHRLHQHCAGRFRCRECDYVRDELDIPATLAAARDRLGGDPFLLPGHREADPWGPLAADSRADNDRFWSTVGDRPTEPREEA